MKESIYLQQLLNNVSKTIQNSVGTMEIVPFFGNRNDENNNSDVLAYLLNPKAKHRQGTKYLTLFLQEIADVNLDVNLKDIISKIDNKVCVYREYLIENWRRIDILIEKSDEFAIILENKIDANDQPTQIIDYYNNIKARYKDKPIFVIYLTKNGKEASMQSIGNTPKGIIFNISYEKHIVNWLEKLPTTENDSSKSSIKSAINQYIYTLKMLTGYGSEEEKLMSDIKESLLKELLGLGGNNLDLESLKKLSETLPDVIKELPFRLIEDKLLKNNILFNRDRDNKAIHIPILENSANITISINPNNWAYFYGITFPKNITQEQIDNKYYKNLDFYEKLNKLEPNPEITWSGGYWWYIGKFICLETNDILDNLDKDVDSMVRLYNECEAL